MYVFVVTLHTIARQLARVQSRSSMFVKPS